MLGTVVAVRLSRSGAPVAVLSDCSAYFLHLGLRSWLKATDSGHAASAFASSLPAPVSGGDVHVLRVPTALQGLPFALSQGSCLCSSGLLFAQAT